MGNDEIDLKLRNDRQSDRPTTEARARLLLLELRHMDDKVLSHCAFCIRV